MAPPVILSRTVSTLRERKKAQTAEAIAAAALELFAARGFPQVTMAQVAAAAGVGERTLYRYFADKEDLLFAEDAGWRDALRAALAERPAQEPPIVAVRAASVAVTDELEDRREAVRRRAAIIAAAPALEARDRAKRAAWATVIAEGLRDRGVPAEHASLLGRITVACFDEALARWLAPGRAPRSLATELGATLDELRAGLGAEG